MGVRRDIYLPEFLQLVDLLGGDLTSPELLLLWRNFHQPGQEAAVLDERLPLWAVPVNVLQAALAGTWLPALQPKHNNCEILVIPAEKHMMLVGLFFYFFSIYPIYFVCFVSALFITALPSPFLPSLLQVLNMNINYLCRLLDELHVWMWRRGARNGRYKIVHLWFELICLYWQVNTMFCGMIMAVFKWQSIK